MEDELAHVLSDDHDLRHLILINNLDCFDLSRKLRSKNRSHLLAAWEDIPEMLNGIHSRGQGILKPLLDRSRLLCSLLGMTEGGNEEIIIVVNVLKIALHIDNKILKAEVCKNIARMSQFSDGILLFYGLCGNALQDLEVPKGRHCPLFFLTDDSGKRVDDCIATALGGNNKYAETLSSHPEVGYYCTPMWVSYLDYYDREARRYAIEHHMKPKSFGDMLIELGFSKIARLDTGLKFISDFEVESKINGFASSYNLGVVELSGNIEIAEKCYGKTKDDLNRSVRKTKPVDP